MQGSHFHLPIWRTDIYKICREMQEHNTPVLATTLSKVSVDYKTVPHQESFALVMGNEGQGISAEMTTLADQLVHITILRSGRKFKCCCSGRNPHFQLHLS